MAVLEMILTAVLLALRAPHAVILIAQITVIAAMAWHEIQRAS